MKYVNQIDSDYLINWMRHEKKKDIGFRYEAQTKITKKILITNIITT